MSARILRVTAPHFVAGAVFRDNLLGQSICFASAPIIKWMVGLPYEAIRSRIDRNPNWGAEWIGGTQVDANLMNVEPEPEPKQLNFL